MKMNAAVLILSLIILSLPASSFSSDEEYWQQFVIYTMNVTLDEENHEVSGTERIVYHNQSPDVINEIWMHLYPNAFKNTETYRVKLNAKNYSTGGVSEKRNGWLEITEFLISMPEAYDTIQTVASIDTATAETLWVKQTRPTSWTESSTHTINEDMLNTKLPKPLAPGDSLVIELEFINHVRPFLGRAGYRGRHYDMAQWYPKMAVYDERGWDSELWPNRGEFYGEFGDFDMTINVPRDYIVGATGVVVEGDPGWSEVSVDTSVEFSDWVKEMKTSRKEKEEEVGEDSMRTVRFKAKMVHDFAWNASADYVYEHGIYESPEGPIDVHTLFTTKVGKRWTKKVVRRGIRVLSWLNDRFGQYPYPQVTIVKSNQGGGMEYPMLVMDGSESEGLISHEVGHIYFYGILGNDEQEEAWLDEGFTSFQTRKYKEHRYGPAGYDRASSTRLSDFEREHHPFNTSWEDAMLGLLYFRSRGVDEPIAQPVAKMKTGWAAGINAYSKPAAMLDMLLSIMGEEAFYAGMQEYYDTWKLKHVNENRWRDIMRKHTDEDIDTFLDQWLHDDGWVDYALGGVTTNVTGEGYEIEVEVVKKGDFWTPVDVLIETEDGDSIIHRYSGKEKSGKFTIFTKSKPTNVEVDPDDRVLDRNRLNNRKGFLKVEVYPDYPGMDYTPRDNYLVTWRPWLWYNEMDGIKPGLVLNKNYGGLYRNLQLGAFYGVDSERLDYRFKWSHPLQRFSYRANYNLAIWEGEGRTSADFHLTWSHSSTYGTPPTHGFKVGYTYLNTWDKSFTYPANSWKEGVESKIYLNYSYDFRGWEWFANINLAIESSQDFFGADDEFNFNKLSTRFKYNRGFHGGDLHFRAFFGGTVAGSLLPPQETYSIAGASGTGVYEMLYLSSPGALFAVKELQQNLHVPGDGNVRGYLTLFPYVPGGDRVASFSLEYRKRHSLPVVGNFLRKYFRRTTLSAFFDGGDIWLDDNGDGELNETSFFADAGVGVQFDARRFRKNWTLRFDFPLFLSETDPFGWVIDAGEDPESNFKFRWIIGLEESF